MASLQLRGDSWRVLFNYNGKQHSFPIGPVDSVEAASWKGKVEHLLMRLKQHLLDLPVGCDIVTFLQHDGKPPTAPAVPAKKPITLGELSDEYLQLHAKLLDPRTVADMRGHWKHLGCLLRLTTEAEALLPNLQKYVMDRVAEGVEPATAKKEIITLRTCWNWGVRMGLLAGAFPNRGLHFPKGTEKPPFMTFAEIERRVAAGEPESLWEGVFLTREEIQEVLDVVRARGCYPWIHPLFCMAAHTGARRSELTAALVTDVNLQDKTVLIREKKRRRDVHESTRRVPLSPALAPVLKDWLAAHPGGAHLFCHSGEIARSKKRSATTGHKGEQARASTLVGRTKGVKKRDTPPPSQLSRTEASDHFRRTLAGTKWQVLPGYHCLRHSFISNCAAMGIDQRLIDSWVGHTTEEMRRRYRHLIPSVEQQAIRVVFGEAATPRGDNAVAPDGK